MNRILLSNINKNKFKQHFKKNIYILINSAFYYSSLDSIDLNN